MKDIVIPPEFIERAGVRQLITQWKILHAKHREKSKRLSWRIKNASRLEKNMRLKKWDYVARILTIEDSLLRWIAKTTKDPDIYTSKRGGPRSRLMTLRRKYDKNRIAAHHMTGIQTKRRRQELREQRKIIVLEIRAIRYVWMKAIYLTVYPDGHTPKPLALHPAELMPRKLKKANARIHHELKDKGAAA